MSDKKRLKKAGRDKNKKNQALREAQAHSGVKHSFATQPAEEKTPTGIADVREYREKVRDKTSEKKWH